MLNLVHDKIKVSFSYIWYYFGYFFMQKIFDGTYLRDNSSIVDKISIYFI